MDALYFPVLCQTPAFDTLLVPFLEMLVHPKHENGTVVTVLLIQRQRALNEPRAAVQVCQIPDIGIDVPECGVVSWYLVLCVIRVRDEFPLMIWLKRAEGILAEELLGEAKEHIPEPPEFIARFDTEVVAVHLVLRKDVSDDALVPPPAEYSRSHNAPISLLLPSLSPSSAPMLALLTLS